MLFINVFICNFALFNNGDNGGYSTTCEAADELQQDLKGEADRVLDEIDFSELESLIESSDVEISLFQGENIKDYIAGILKSEKTIEISDCFESILLGTKEKLKMILQPLFFILVVVLINNIFNVFKSDKVSGVSEIIYFICFSVIVIFVSATLSDIITLVRNTVKNINSQMSAIFPIIISLLTSAGGVVSVKSYSPMVLVLSKIVSSIFVNILFPLFALSLVLSIIGNMSKNVKLTKFNGFVKSIFKWIIGVVFAVFMGVLSVKGLIAGMSDGISIKAMKYAIKNYIPMLGGYISEGFELVKAVGILIKNATGVIGIILLFSNILSPLIILALFELGLKLIAGVVEVVGDKKSSDLLFDVAGSLKLLVVILIGVALMYFFTIFLLICSASNFL